MKQICRLLIVVSFLFNVASAVAAQTVSVSPASVESPAVGAQLTVSLKITGGRNVAGYQATVTFDTSALRYVNSANGDYLPAGAIFVPPSVSGNQVTVAATTLVGESNGDGPLATVTLEVISVGASALTLTEVVLSDGAGNASRPQVENGQITRPSQVKVVTIPDANLRAAIESELGKASGATITTADMAKLPLLDASDANISDLTGLEHATNLTGLYLGFNSISDLSALTGLTNLTDLELYGNSVSDISPLASLTNLTSLHLEGNAISDISALSGLTNLTWLSVGFNNIVDISILAGLTNLESLGIYENNISNIAPLSRLTNLTDLDLEGNAISDISALSSLTNLTWLNLQDNNISNISSVSGLTNLTHLWLWANNISDLSPLVSNTGLGAGDAVGLNENPLNTVSINSHIPTLRERGVDVQFDLNTNATVSVFPSSVHSPAVGDQFTLSLRIAGGNKVTGYQASVQFDASALRYVGSADGDYLPAGAFFIPPIAEGNSVTLAGTSLSGESAQNTGTLATITFSVVAVKASTVYLWDVLLTDSLGGSSSPQVEDAVITEVPQLPEDVNQDGVVNILDLTLVAFNFGKTGQNDADVNGDGIVNIVDLVAVAGAFGNAAAPTSDPRALAMLTAAEVGQWVIQAQTLNVTDAASRRGILFLEQLLAVLTPKETALHANYPNPFNPETWIPYQLAKPAEVTITIYDMNGGVVRRVEVGNQPAGIYQNRSRAAYWDGRNQHGEPVASGIYFYTLRAGEFAATRKMLVRK